MKLLKDFIALEEKIHAYFGYQEDWVKIPLDDETDKHWMVNQNENGGSYSYSPEPFTVESIEAGKALYSGRIYTQRFLPKWVYRGEEYTMVSADTGCDGNKFLMVFSNYLECTDETLKQLCDGKWGHI